MRAHGELLMKPFYDEDGITIYHGDCREILPTLEPADAAIIDPPYSTNYYASDDASFSPELAYKMIGPLAVFGWPEALCGLAAALDQQPDEWICWAPTNGRMRGMNRHGLWRESEHIAVFGKGDWGRLRQPRRPTTTPMPEKDKRVKGDSGPVRMGDVWTDPSPNLNPRQYHKRHHPNEKPVPILERLILALTEPDDTVLDCFMGSGTTLVAARNLGRRAVGIEVEEEHCETAVARLGEPSLPLAGVEGVTGKACGLVGC